ncbi:unnamed protein product, partial [Didymodactylos carnosus]
AMAGIGGGGPNNSGPLKPQESKIIRYTPIDVKDPTDALLEACYQAIQQLSSSQNRFSLDSNTLFQISQTNKKSKMDISHGLLYGILTDTTTGGNGGGVLCSKHFHDLLLLNGTNFSYIIGTLETLISKNWKRFYDNIRQQLYWFLKETISSNIDGIDRLYYVYLRNINPYESRQERCLELCEKLIELLLVYPLFLKSYPEMLLLTIYTYLCVIPAHSQFHSKLRQREIDFILSLLRDHSSSRWDCIGRDLFRLFAQISHIKDIDLYLKHLSTTTSQQSPDFLQKILQQQTEPKFLALPLTFDLEKKLRFLLENCRQGYEKYYFEWFQQQFLNFKQQPETIYLCSHIIRWQFIWWMLTQLSAYLNTVQVTAMASNQIGVTQGTTSSTNTSNHLIITLNEQLIQCKLAIYYDWLFYDQSQQLLEHELLFNSIEPGYQLLIRSHYTKPILLFILHLSENYISNLKYHIQQNIKRLFNDFLHKHWLNSFQQLLQYFANDRDLSHRLQMTLFVLPQQQQQQIQQIMLSGIPVNEESVMNDDISPNAMMPPRSEHEKNEEDNDVMMLQPVRSPTAGRFSDDDEDEDSSNSNTKISKTNDEYDDDDDTNDDMIIDPSSTIENERGLYSISLTRDTFPFQQFRLTFITEKCVHLATTYLHAPSIRMKCSLIEQLYNEIVTSDGKMFQLGVRTIEKNNGGIQQENSISYSMIKYDKYSDKFQTKLLSLFQEKLIVNGLMCLYLLRAFFVNRLLPNKTQLQTSATVLSKENNLTYSPKKLQRTLKTSPVYVLFQLILTNDDQKQEYFIRLLQAMYYFQSEIAYYFLYYLAVEQHAKPIEDLAKIYEKFSYDIIKLNCNQRKADALTTRDNNRQPMRPLTIEQENTNNFVDFLYETLVLCEQDDTETFLFIFSYVFRLYSKKLYNNIKLIRLFIQTINESEHKNFLYQILTRRLQLFHASKLYMLIDQTLLFTSQEQQYFWDLLSAHDFIQNDYEQLFTNIIEHLQKFSVLSITTNQRYEKSPNFIKHRNTIALNNVLDILKNKEPTYGLVCSLLAHELTQEFSFKLWTIWNKQHKQKLWIHLDRIITKWLQREHDSTTQQQHTKKIDYKIGLMKMAAENGLTYILEHLTILLEQLQQETNNQIQSTASDADNDDDMDCLTIDDTTTQNKLSGDLIIPMSKTTGKNLVMCIKKHEEIVEKNKEFVDKLEQAKFAPTVIQPPPPSITSTKETTITSTTNVIRNSKYELTRPTSSHTSHFFLMKRSSSSTSTKSSSPSHRNGSSREKKRRRKEESKDKKRHESSKKHSKNSSAKASRSHRSRSKSRSGETPTSKDKKVSTTPIVGPSLQLPTSGPIDKEAEQKRLEDEMQKRKERVEKWRAERKRAIESSRDPQTPVQITGKAWSLEDDADDDELQNTSKNFSSDLKREIAAARESIIATQSGKQKAKEDAAFAAQQASVTTLPTNVEDDEDDPLDKFMENISSEVKTLRKKTYRMLPPLVPAGTNIKKEEETVVKHVKPLNTTTSVVTVIKKKVKQNDEIVIKVEPEEESSSPSTNGFSSIVKTEYEQKPLSISKVTLKSGIAKHGKDKGLIMEQDIDGLEYSSEDEKPDEFDDMMTTKKSKADMIITDHSKIYYRPYRKDFYTEVPEITRMTNEEVAAYREELDGIKVTGKRCPKPIKTWSQCITSNKILSTLKKFEYEKPTPIQAQALPVIFSGRDMIGIAKTGSGKTLAFLLPIFRHIKAQPPLDPDDGPIAIIMTPTRELSLQTTKECKKFSKLLDIRCVAVYGGTGISEQIAELKRGAEIIVCTPGRMIDMLAANGGKVTNLRRVTYVVLDEADRMFDLGFEPQVNKILDNIRPDRQTVMFSATFPKQMEALARKALNKPIEVAVGGRSVVCKDVEQHVEMLEDDEKYLKLLELLGIYQEQGSVIVFVDKQEHADELMKNLLKNSYPCMSLHGGIDQYDRDSTMVDFKSGDIRLMIATSVAARGLDVKDLILVVNYDCPNHYEDYVHRCGRTGRAGNKGYAFTFITPEQERYAGDIVRALELSNTEVPEALKLLWEGYIAKMEAVSKKVKSGGGFSGKGYKFDSSEEQMTDERRKVQIVMMGIHDSDEEEESVDIDQQIDSLFKSKRRIKDKTEIPVTQPGTGAGAGSSSPASTTASGTASTTATPAVTTAAEAAAKLELAKKYASRINFNKSESRDTVQLATTSLFQGGTLNQSFSSRVVAEQIAGQLNIRLNYQKPETEELVKEDAFKVFEEELEINDFPQNARWKVTSKETCAHVSEYADVGMTVRGQYYPNGKDPIPGDRKLYLALESLTERGLQLAKTEIARLIKEEMMKMQNPAMQLVNRGRYKVI